MCSWYITPVYSWRGRERERLSGFLHITSMMMTGIVSNALKDHVLVTWEGCHRSQCMWSPNWNVLDLIFGTMIINSMNSSRVSPQGLVPEAEYNVAYSSLKDTDGFRFRSSLSPMASSRVNADYPDLPISGWYGFTCSYHSLQRWSVSVATALGYADCT